jgi:hypothetical protein
MRFARRTETPSYDVPERFTGADEGELPTVAVVTMARDEGTMMRRWVDHYVAEVGAEAVLVIDDHTVDGSTDDLPCPVLKVPYLRKKSFEPSRMALVSGVANGLLAAYDAVLFCDADEFVVADPQQHPTLRHFVATRPGRAAVGVVAMNVLHDVANEAPLDATRPILGQRQYAKFLPLMCKPSLKMVPADWVLASHGIKAPFEVDPELWMFHMKFADRDHLLRVAELRHELNVAEGRAGRTSWAKPADEMVAVLDEAAAGIGTGHRMFDPRRASVALDTIVEQPEPGLWRAVGQGQAKAMRRRPVARIPRRFHGRF